MYVPLRALSHFTLPHSLSHIEYPIDRIEIAGNVHFPFNSSSSEAIEMPREILKHTHTRTHVHVHTHKNNRIKKVEAKMESTKKPQFTRTN